MKATLKKIDIDGEFSRFSLYWPSWAKDLRCCCTPDRGDSDSPWFQSSYAIGADGVSNAQWLLTDPPGTTPCFGPRPNGSTSLPAPGFKNYFDGEFWGDASGQSRLRSRQVYIFGMYVCYRFL